ncbi:MAG TPA: hypothetical protein VH186_22190 [Chloroflexia bacterium]|nr:hypothetical protein [Chloroflexia bacterium]
MEQEHSYRKSSEQLFLQASKLVYRLGARFWLGFALFCATVFGGLALLSLVSGAFLFALGTLVTGSMFCASSLIFYRYCKAMLNLIHQNDIYKW